MISRDASLLTFCFMIELFLFSFVNGRTEFGKEDCRWRTNGVTSSRATLCQAVLSAKGGLDGAHFMRYVALGVKQTHSSVQFWSEMMMSVTKQLYHN